VIPDPNISIDDISKKFISTSFNIAKTSMSEVRKSFFHLSLKIFNSQKQKMKLYKAIKRSGSYHNLDEFEELIEKYNRMCKIINDMYNIYRKTEY